jgi:hypothetical protein
VYLQAVNQALAQVSQVNLAQAVVIHQAQAHYQAQAQAQVLHVT